MRSGAFSPTNDPHSIRPRRGFFCAGSNWQVAHPSHLRRAQLGFLCEVTPAPRTSEPFDELSARIFLCRVNPALGHPAKST